MKECIFCQKFNTYQSFGPLLTKALYSKYSSSQNYYYSKDINDIINGATNSKVINYKYNEMLDDEEEYLKRIYGLSEYDFKINALSE